MITIEIPHVESPGKASQFQFVESELIRVEEQKELRVQMQYPRMKMHNALDMCYVRREVYDLLCRANSLLPKGVELCIWDAWRPFKLQQELYEAYSKSILKDFGMETGTEEEKARLISSYVSVPVSDRQKAPVHTTGGAVDVTLVDKRGKELKMGTAFDSFSAKAHTDYFENDDMEVRENRRILYAAMTAAGFTNLPSEWWHYDYGDAFWAYYKREPVMYRGVFTLEEILHGIERNAG